VKAIDEYCPFLGSLLAESERAQYFPSSSRRGGRDNKIDAAKPPLVERTGW
jgi:hypothetical protein